MMENKTAVHPGNSTVVIWMENKTVVNLSSGSRVSWILVVSLFVPAIIEIGIFLNNYRVAADSDVAEEAASAAVQKYTAKQKTKYFETFRRFLVVFCFTFVYVGAAVLRDCSIFVWDDDNCVDGKICYLTLILTFLSQCWWFYPLALSLVFLSGSGLIVLRDIYKTYFTMDSKSMSITTRYLAFVDNPGETLSHIFEGHYFIQRYQTKIPYEGIDINSRLHDISILLNGVKKNIGMYVSNSSTLETTLVNLYNLENDNNNDLYNLLHSCKKDIVLFEFLESFLKKCSEMETLRYILVDCLNANKNKPSDIAEDDWKSGNAYAFDNMQEYLRRSVEWAALKNGFVFLWLDLHLRNSWVFKLLKFVLSKDIRK